MLLQVWGSNPRKRKLCRLWRKEVTRGFQHGAGRFGVMQSDVHSHMVVELSAVESSMNIFQRCNTIINQTLKKPKYYVVYL